MTEEEKHQILEDAKDWFVDTVSANHIKNTLELGNSEQFNINPFLAVYLANFLTGESTAKDIAKALIYPRVLGTSITTTFGSAIQKFTNEVLSAYASIVGGLDIEFIDQTDGRRKYCQLKSGPNTINKDDVETIAGHFSGIKNLARQNGLPLQLEDLVVAVIYGEPNQLSSHYKRIASQYHHPVIIGEEFWYRLTGDPEFYFDLIQCIGEVALNANFSEELEQIINELSQNPEIRALASKLDE